MITPAKVYIAEIGFSPMCTWEEQLRSGASHTPESYDIWKVGYLCPPPTLHAGKVIVVHFDQPMPTHLLLHWGTSEGLEPAHPRMLFALGAHNHELPSELEKRSVGVASLSSFIFRGEKWACTLWWYPKGNNAFHQRIAFLTRFNGEGSWSKDHAFIFIAKV